MATFFWYDLSTSDTKSAEAFYGKVVGWTAAAYDGAQADYIVFSAQGAGVAGLAPLRGDGSTQWSGYIHVGDVDAYAKRIDELGGTICRDAWDAEGVGRMLVAADPLGAMFFLMTPAGSEARPTIAAESPGQIGWRELHSADWERAFEFYSSLFDWKKDDAVDMGPMGTYQLFSVDGVQTGGMMNKTDPSAPSSWLYYFVVDAIDAGVNRVTENGGRVLQGPHPVPGGNWVAQCTDPQGAHFAIVSNKR